MSDGILEVRLAGRGGQGVVTAGEVLGKAVVLEDRHAQSIPTFGPERRGALAQSTLRVSDTVIRLKYAAARPSALLVLDPSIWRHANVTLGLCEGATLVFNSPSAPEEIEAVLRGGTLPYTLGIERARILTVDATGIALDVLGRPIPNTVLMGALTGAVGLVDMESLEMAICERFPKTGDLNVVAARTGRDRLRGAVAAGLARGV